MTPAEKLAASAAKVKKTAAKVVKGKERRKRPYAKTCGVKAVRTALGLSAMSVAKAVGVNYLTLLDAEGGANPTLLIAQRIAAFFGKTVDELWPCSKPAAEKTK